MKYQVSSMKYEMRRGLLLLGLLLAVVVAGMSMSPFRRHKFDVFRVLPARDSATVFYGNSITNMFEWREALGDAPEILNRGVSGAVVQELIDNAPAIARLRPAKLFIGIGTNDLGNEDLCAPDSVATRITRLVEYFRNESPETEIFVQSILPSEHGIRTLEAIKSTNTLVKEKVEDLGAVYVDLFDLLSGVPTKEISYDGLHLTARGYARWLEAIAPLTGHGPVFTDTVAEDNGGISTNSFGMRNTYFSVLPVREADILFVGDELIHGCEWHELLDDPRIKNRGTGWGYGGITLSDWRNAVRPILAAGGDKEAPAAIYLYAGSESLYREGTDLDSLISEYRLLIDNIRELAPAGSTPLRLLSLIPRSDPRLNKTLTEPFNERLRSLAEETDNAIFIDLYEPLSDKGGAPLEGYVDEDFLTGAGYTAIARLLSPTLPAQSFGEKE